MKKKIAFILILIISFSFIFFIPENPLPKNYRHSTDHASLMRMFSKRCRQVDWSEGEKTNVSGSGYLKPNHFQNLLIKKPEDVYLFDFSFNDHDSLYVNHKNLKWHYGLVQRGDKLEPINKGIFKQIKYKIRQWIARAKGVEFENCHDEKTEFMQYPRVKQYYRLNPTSWLGDLTYIDSLLEQFESIPKTAHIYVHCNRGRGRTSTFMVLYDIYRNHTYSTLQTLIDKQYCMGGEDLNNIQEKTSGTWKSSALVARKNLIHYFYAYMKDPKGYHAQKWSQWMIQHNIENHANLKEYKKSSANQ